MALEVLNFPLVLFGSFAAWETSPDSCVSSSWSRSSESTIDIHRTSVFESSCLTPFARLIFRPAVALDLDQSHPGRNLQAHAPGPARDRARWGPDPEVEASDLWYG